MIKRISVKNVRKGEEGGLERCVQATDLEPKATPGMPSADCIPIHLNLSIDSVSV